MDFALRNRVANELRAVDAPSTIPELERLLDHSLEVIQEHSCGCPVCTAALVGVAATRAVMNDAVLMSPGESERGIAGLIYRLHVVHMNHALNAMMYAREGEVVALADPPPEIKEVIVQIIKKLAEGHKK